MELEDFGPSSLAETRIHYDLSTAVAKADVLIVLEADTQNDVEVSQFCLFGALSHPSTSD